MPRVLGSSSGWGQSEAGGRVVRSYPSEESERVVCVGLRCFFLEEPHGAKHFLEVWVRSYETLFRASALSHCLFGGIPGI